MSDTIKKEGHQPSNLCPKCGTVIWWIDRQIRNVSTAEENYELNKFEFTEDVFVKYHCNYQYLMKHDEQKPITMEHCNG